MLITLNQTSKCTLLLPLLVILIVFVLIPRSVNGRDRKIFVSKFVPKAEIQLNQLKTIRKTIRQEAVKNLRSLPSEIKSMLIKTAETAFTKENYPVKTVDDYLEFNRTGNRAPYEKKVSDHQRRIAALVVGNLLDQLSNKTSTKYIKEIINGVWILMEESTWCWPAHITVQQGTGDPLPTPGSIAIDLGAGESAKFVGWVKLLVGHHFDSVSSVVNRRIDYELRKRIFEPYIRIYYSWMGLKGEQVNNWNIWINGNILKSAVFTLDDMTLFNEVLNMTLYSADKFLDSYGDDGATEEGADYWRQAGGRLIEYLTSLQQLYPNDKKYFKSVKLLKLIGDYSYKMHIKDKWFVNFADSIPLITYPPPLLAMYGKMFSDSDMKKYSAFMWRLLTQGWSDAGYINSRLIDLNEFMNTVNWRSKIAKSKAVAPEPTLVWLPDVQVMVMRKKTKKNVEFLLAAKAGTNHESHNHNDVGSFMLYQNGNAVLIDIGVGTYNSETFGENRYKLFYMQSQYHNTPTINGIQQKAGSSFEAKDVSFTQLPKKKGVVFSADIAGAYPAESKAKRWTRTVTFSLTSNLVTLEEQYELSAFTAPQKLHFIMVKEINVTETSSGLLLSDSVKGSKVTMVFDLKVFSFAVESKSLDGDQHLTQVWGESVQRLTLTTNANFKQLTGNFTILFSETK